MSQTMVTAAPTPICGPRWLIWVGKPPVWRVALRKPSILSDRRRLLRPLPTAASAASFDAQNRICKEIALQRPKTGKFG